MNTEVNQAEYEEFLAYKAQQAKAAERQRSMESYRDMVDEAIDEAVAEAKTISGQMAATKQSILECFQAAIAMKREELGLGKDGQRTHAFTNSEGTKRVQIGVNILDGYLDTVNEGIDMVTAYIESLAKDEASKALVSMVMRLIAKDKQGNIKASRLVQLSRIAKESGSEAFIEGVRLIEESYTPQVTKLFVRIEEKNADGSWRIIPLTMTDVPLINKQVAQVMGNVLPQETE